MLASPQAQKRKRPVIVLECISSTWNLSDNEVLIESINASADGYAGAVATAVVPAITTVGAVADAAVTAGRSILIVAQAVTSTAPTNPDTTRSFFIDMGVFSLLASVRWYTTARL